MLFSPLDELKDHQYTSKSHLFNRAVIASYNNVAKYGIICDADWIAIRQQQRNLVFLLGKDPYPDPLRKTVIYKEEPFEGCDKNPIKEVVYDLDNFFGAPDKVMRRLMRFKERPEIKWDDPTKDQCIDVFEKWSAAKKANPKVFQITFNPDRYKRSYDLVFEGFNIYQKMVWVRDIPYGVINFAIEGDQAYELSFCSLYFDKELKLINDQNEAIIISALYDLYNMGVRSVNLGTDAGIKGLAFFKKRFDFRLNNVYTQKISK